MATSSPAAQVPAVVRRVGVVGGGQLAWMMGPAATQLGLELVVQTPHPSDPAVAVAAETVFAAVDDLEGTAALAQRCDVITLENEFIDPVGLATLAQRVPVYPAPAILQTVVDKAHQRQRFADLGLPNPAYAVLDGPEDAPHLLARAEELGFPLVLKTRRMGYDGYGTFVIATAADLHQQWQQLGQPPVLLEAFVPFERELAVMVARNLQGDIAVYPTVETQQVQQICRRVLAPAPVPAAVDQQVQHIARTLATGLDLVGLLGVELFLTPQGEVLLNEIAPRPHNSGHYTLDACPTSQFEQLLRAVGGLPLGPTHLTCPQAVMVNLLGTAAPAPALAHRRQQLQQQPHSHLYWYNKAEARPGRKLGHITQCLPAEADPAAAAATLEALWYGD